MTTERVGRAIGWLVGAVTRAPALTVLLVLGLTGLSLYYAAGHLGINTDTADMISPELSWRQDFIAYRDNFPSRDRNLVVVIDGPGGEASMEYARDLARALRAEPERFPAVFLPGDGEFFDRNGLLYLPVAELEALSDRLVDAQPLLGRLAGNVSGAGILEVLGDSVERRDELPAAAAADSDRIFGEIAASLMAQAAGSRQPVLWGGLLGTSSSISARQLLLVRPALDFSRVRPAVESIDRLREIASELRAEHGSAIDVRLTGTLAMEHEELTSITQSASAAGTAALIMVIVVLLVTLRSVSLLLVSVLTLLAGLGLTAAFAALTVGHLNLLSVAFAVLYIGLGVDFILHLCLRLRELRHAGIPLDAALVETASGVGSSLMICAVTTAVGFFAFIPTDFDGISELGLISGSGMLISLIVSLTLLPALIRLFWRGDAKREQARPPWLAGLRPKSLPPRLTLAIAGAVGLVALWLLPGLRFDGNPINLRDPSSESIRALEDLAADSEAPLFNLVVLVPDAATAAATASELDGLPSVERVQTVASLVPNDQAEKLLILEDLDVLLGPTLRSLDERAPVDRDRFVAALDGLGDSLAGSATRSEAELAFLAAVESWRRSLLRAPSAAAAAAAIEASDAALVGNLVEQIARLNRGLGARPVTRDDLPRDLRERWVNDAGHELVEVVPRENLNDSEAAERFVSEVRAVAPNATGLPVVYEEASATVTSAFTQALSYAFLAVTLLLLVFMRSVRDALMVLVPIVFAAVVTAGASVALGLPLNFANIIALPLLVGVGVDSGIHMVHRMRTEPPRDGELLHTSTSRAVFASAVTTVASFGNLAFSSHLGMASMGQLLTLGMAMSLVAVLVVLPALMRLGARS